QVPTTFGAALHEGVFTPRATTATHATCSDCGWMSFMAFPQRCLKLPPDRSRFHSTRLVVPPRPRGQGRRGKPQGESGSVSSCCSKRIIHLDDCRRFYASGLANSSLNAHICSESQGGSAGPLPESVSQIKEPRIVHGRRNAKKDVILWHRQASELLPALRTDGGTSSGSKRLTAVQNASKERHEASPPKFSASCRGRCRGGLAAHGPRAVQDARDWLPGPRSTESERSGRVPSGPRRSRLRVRPACGDRIPLGKLSLPSARACR